MIEMLSGTLRERGRCVLSTSARESERLTEREVAAPVHSATNVQYTVPIFCLVSDAAFHSNIKMREYSY